MKTKINKKMYAIIVNKILVSGIANISAKELLDLKDKTTKIVELLNNYEVV